jgi:hypothetical protein
VSARPPRQVDALVLRVRAFVRLFATVSESSVKHGLTAGRPRFLKSVLGFLRDLAGRIEAVIVGHGAILWFGC